MTSYKIVVLAGGLHKDSFNHKFATAMAKLTPISALMAAE